MTAQTTQAAAVDCDVHPILPSVRSLEPYLSDYWRDQLAAMRFPSWEPNFHPPASPIGKRPGIALDQDGRAATRVELLTADVFADGLVDYAILNPLYGVQLTRAPHREAALARALNEWIAREWLDADDRLRASIVVPMGSPHLAVEEIRHWQHDRRFVQVMLLAHSEMALGRSIYWPVFAAAEEAGLPVAIHLGSVSRQAPSAAGWPQYYLEWYVGQQGAAEAQLASLLMEGVFQLYPKTRIVLTELGFAWFAPLSWKLDKLWKTNRPETPWVDRPPSEVLRDHVRFTTSPADGAQAPGALERTLERMGGTDLLLYSSDYPHAHASAPTEIFDGIADAGLAEQILRGTAGDLYGLTTMAKEGAR